MTQLTLEHVAKIARELGNTAQACGDASNDRTAKYHYYIVSFAAHSVGASAEAIIKQEADQA